MSNPVLVEVVRSGFLEGVHRGALVVTAPDGAVRFSLGEVDGPVFPRSANKPFQALGMLAAGVELDDADLAIAAGSHNGEPEHVRRALALLERHGLSESDLGCPADWPQHEPSRLAQIRSGGQRRRAAMNCSGKHAAMLATCVQQGWPVRGYLEPEHKLQQVITDTIADTVSTATGERLAATGVDGCGAPLLAFSLTALARSFGTLTRRTDRPDARVAASMRAHPWLVAGTGREDTLLMLAVPGLLAKGGAEGVHALALPDGTAVALKVDDGGQRAREPLLVACLRALGALPEDPAALGVLGGLAGTGAVHGGGRPVGDLRVPAGLLNGLAAS